MPPGQSNEPGGILTFSTYIMPPWHFVYTKSQDAARHGIFRFFLQNWSQIWSFFTKCIFSGKFWRKMWTSWNIQFFQRLKSSPICLLVSKCLYDVVCMLRKAKWMEICNGIHKITDQNIHECSSWWLRGSGHSAVRHSRECTKLFMSFCWIWLSVAGIFPWNLREIKAWLKLRNIEPG